MSSPVTLVTGATGLVGNNVVRQLLASGQQVRVMVRGSSDSRPLEGLCVEVVRGDVCDAESVQRACRGVARVVHSAGYVRIGRSQLEHHRAVNVDGTRYVAQSAREAGARMIHVSSSDAMGILSPKEPVDEDTPLAPPPPVPYVITKREAEVVVLDEVSRGLDAVIVNPGFMLGPWDWKPSSGRMLLEVGAGKGKLAPRGWLSLCDVRDVVSGIISAIDRGQCGRRYLLAGETMLLLDAWRLFADTAGVPRPWCRAGPLMLIAVGWGGDVWTRLTGREPDVNSGAIAMARLPKNYSSKRAATELGYKTRPVRETVQDSWDWFKDHGFVDQPHRTSDG